MVGFPHEGPEGDTDDALAGVAVDGAEGMELFKVDCVDRRFLLEFAPHGCFEGFVVVDESSWQGPLPRKGFQSPPDQQNLQSAAIETEDHGINRERWTGEFVREGHVRNGIPELWCGIDTK